MNEGVKSLVDVMSEQSIESNDEILFDEAFTLYHRAVFRAAFAIVRESTLAEDIAQETFIQLYKNLDSVKDAEILRPWLIRVSLNLAKNKVRGNSRANAREEIYVKESSDIDERTAEREYENREISKEVRETLGRINEPMRSCLLLKQQGLSYREIAETLYINENSVGSYLARAKKEFVRLYGKIGGER